MAVKLMDKVDAIASVLNLALKYHDEHAALLQADTRYAADLKQSLEAAVTPEPYPVNTAARLNQLREAAGKVDGFYDRYRDRLPSRDEADPVRMVHAALRCAVLL